MVTCSYSLNPITRANAHCASSPQQSPIEWEAHTKARSHALRAFSFLRRSSMASTRALSRPRVFVATSPELAGIRAHAFSLQAVDWISGADLGGFVSAPEIPFPGNGDWH
jgi:hypothetical protein